MRSLTLPILGFSLAVLAGCSVFQKPSDSELIHREESPSQAPLDLLHGQEAAARGDWVAALAFFERSYREKPSILNEFNLATAYQRAGKGALAVPLYLDLVDRGQSSEVTPVQNRDQTFDQKAPARDIADEARERLIRMHAMSLRSDQRNASSAK